MINDALLYFTKKGGDLLPLVDGGPYACSKTVDLEATGAVDEELFLTVVAHTTTNAFDANLSIRLHDADTHAPFFEAETTILGEVPVVKTFRMPRHSPPFKGVLECTVEDHSADDDALIEIFLTSSQQKKLLKIV